MNRRLAEANIDDASAAGGPGSNPYAHANTLRVDGNNNRIGASGSGRARARGGDDGESATAIASARHRRTDSGERLASFVGKFVDALEPEEHEEEGKGEEEAIEAFIASIPSPVTVPLATPARRAQKQAQGRATVPRDSPNTPSTSALDAQGEVPQGPELKQTTADGAGIGSRKRKM